MLKLKQTPSQRPLPILSAQLFPLKAAAYSKDKLKLLIPTMQQFQRLFQDKLGRIQSSSSRVPVTCSLLDAFHSQKALMESSLRRRENTARKNQMTAQENLKYRQQLEQKLRMLQQKHSKNRKEALSKVVKSEQRRNNYRRDILSKHHENDKNQMREKLKLSRQHAQDMQEYWSGKKMKTQRSFRSQSAVKPLYGESVERKYALQRGESERGLQVREKFIERHEGREEKVHNVYLKKKEEVLLPQREQFSKVLQQGEDILDKRITSLINSIGDDFRMSGQVLKGKFKALQKKLKDKKIDDYDHKMTVRSNFLDRAKQRSSSLSQCVCKRINNIEEAVSPLLKETARHMHQGDTLKKLQREPSETRTRNSQFLTRSQSFRSTTAYNQSLLSQRKQEVDTERLRREREIAQSLALKRTMEVEGNCYVRKTRVA